MSFYVTLPSNSSRREFPDNSLTHYTTKLRNPIKLEGQYEVSLVEMIYPKNWKYRNDANIRLYQNNNSNEFTIIKVQFFVNETLKELLARLNNLFSISDTAAEIEYHDQSGKIFILLPENAKLVFEDGIESVFGFNNFEFTGSLKENKELIVFYSENVVNSKLNNINSLYIYTDIVEYQIVGDVNAPLLQVVSTGNEANSLIEKIYDSPHYIPVMRSNIETIEIDIRSDLGEKIQFQSGQVIIKLHFRRKNFYFS